ncbi:Hpt domain-containing protein [Paraburkholderia sp. Tr-20389]|uniref:Hpt domain-containing protein n=1 Tax=Paraburkholderia sp. Tr-20389 TaxID=2703903 RepID=UPI001981E151|nr:Hpt domain-containing protein [Paraburkholderia sp. Tr-20389]MBN3752477.1 Hpt domain-containing protein [Paraburkholderia sp. Tr-20389]
MMAACARRAFGRAVEANALQERIDVLALGDRAVAQDVTSALIDTNGATLRYMSTAQESGDWDGMGRAAHRLAGSLSMLQCSREIALAMRLERAALEHDAWAIATLLPIVTKAIARLNEQLSALLA